MKIKRIVIIAFLIFFYQLVWSQSISERIIHISDSIFEKHLKAREYLTGGVISVVNKDSILFKKGYGISNREKSTLFNPDKTIVQIASVTKLITTTAVLQLMEKNKIDLNKPITFYLPNLNIKNSYSKGVLVKHLLMHTAGLDDRTSYMEAKSKDAIIPLKDYAESYIPDVIWEPGKFFNYSNYAFVVLAYLVESVEQMPFEEYVIKNILEPLEMHNSGFGYEPKLMNNLMERYRLRENNQNEIYSQKADTKFTNLLGVTGFKTTADDMCRFMMFYLNNGIYKGKQILKKQTIDNAFLSQFTYDKNINRQQGLGWRIELKSGTRILYHYGDDVGVESSLVLFKEKGIGLFTAFNNPVGYDVKTEIQNAIFSKLYGKRNDANTSNPSNDIGDLSTFAGDYFYMNDSHTTFEKIGFLLGNKKIKVEVEGDSIINIDGQRFTSTEGHLLFKQIDGKNLVKFIVDSDSNTAYYTYGTSTFRKIAKWESPKLHLMLFLVSISTMVLFLVVSLVRWISRKKKKAKNTSVKSSNILILGNFSVLLFIGGFAIYTSTLSTLSYGPPTGLKILFALPIIVVILALFSMYYLLKESHSRKTNKAFKALKYLNIIAILIVSAIFYNYNFIGFNFV